MYKDFFHLREYPFNTTPDPQFLYFSRQHRVALDLLQYGIRARKGFIVITGEIGTGKTTLCRALLNTLDAGTRTALILNPMLSDAQILRVICDEFRLQPARTTKKDLYDTLNAFLLRELAANHNVALIVDEAQNLKPRVLEQIRLLSNLETEKEKLLQIIFVGQPELRALLNRPDLRQLRQRIALHHHIGPLEPDEIGAYIHHRLRVAGEPGRLQWSADAIQLIAQHTHGLPRVINILCDAVLLAAYVAETYHIEPSLVELAIRECGLTPLAPAELPAA
ncbi:MAG: AAA family ATPase [Verrucomicrobiae bacterium]|nr:AAA family ATPase [Verrucomicrobiae bacterium]